MSIAHATLSFPLNVYAHCLFLADGRADYLHYGLFENPDETAQVTQQRSTELVLSRLPAPPARVLEIGPGLGTTAAKLTSLGYDVTAITPDAAQVEIARQRAPAADFHVQAFEQFSVIEGDPGFDVILLQESSQYLDTLFLFQRAWQLLREDGCVLILDEFGLNRSEKDLSGALPMRQHVVRQASQSGFGLEELMDLSSSAAPTVDYLLKHIRQYRPQLLAELPVTDEHLDSLIADLEAYRGRYREGRYGYALLQFRRLSKPKTELRLLETPQQITALYPHLSHRHSEQLPQALWDWRYAQLPGRAASAWQGLDLNSFCGMQVRHLVRNHQPLHALQVQDWLSEASAELDQSALQCCLTLLERWTGYACAYELGLGFFSHAMLRELEKQKMFRRNTAVYQYRLHADIGYPQFSTRIKHLKPEQDADKINQLWAEMQSEFTDALLGVRDWANIQYRYEQYPCAHADMYILSQRFTGKPLALLVLRRVDEQTCELIDYVGSLQHIEHALTQSQRIAARWGCEHLIFRYSGAFSQQLPMLSDKAELQDYSLAFSCWNPGPDVGELRYWFSGGDIDTIQSAALSSVSGEVL